MCYALAARRVLFFTHHRMPLHIVPHSISSILPYFSLFFSICYRHAWIIGHSESDMPPFRGNHREFHDSLLLQEQKYHRQTYQADQGFARESVAHGPELLYSHHDIGVLHPLDASPDRLRWHDIKTALERHHHVFYPARFHEDLRDSSAMVCIARLNCVCRIDRHTQANVEPSRRHIKRLHGTLTR